MELLILFYGLIFVGAALAKQQGGGRLYFPFAPQETQMLAAEAMSPYQKRKVIGYGGPKFGGKSWTIQYLASMFFLSRPIRILIIGHKYEDMLALHVEPLKGYLKDYIDTGLVTWNDTKKSFFCKQWGSQIKFQQVSRDSDARSLNGQSWDIVLIDEAQKLSPFSLTYIQGICRISHTQSGWRTRLRNDYKKAESKGDREVMAQLKQLWSDTYYWPKMLYCFNWGEKGHGWLRRIFWDGCKHEGDPFLRLDMFARRADGTFRENPENFHFIFAPMDKNKIGMSEDPSYVDNIESMEEPYRTAYLTGNPDAFTGLKYQINPLVHEVDFDELLRSKGYEDAEGPYVPDHWYLYGSIDSGNDCAAGLFVRTPEGKNYQIDEYMEYAKDLPYHVKEIGESWARNRWTRGRMPSITFGDKYAFAKKEARGWSGSTETFAKRMWESFAVWMSKIESDRVTSARAVGSALYYVVDNATNLVEEPNLYFATYKTGNKDPQGYDEYFRCGKKTIEIIVSMESNPNRPDDVRNEPGIDDHCFDMMKVYLMGAVNPPELPPDKKPVIENREYGSHRETDRYRKGRLKKAESEDISTYGGGDISGYA